MTYNDQSMLCHFILKKGARIARDQYDIARRAALATLPKSGAGMTLTDFRAGVVRRLFRAGRFGFVAARSFFGGSVSALALSAPSHGV